MRQGQIAFVWKYRVQVVTLSIKSQNSEWMPPVLTKTCGYDLIIDVYVLVGHINEPPLCWHCDVYYKSSKLTLLLTFLL